MRALEPPPPHASQARIVGQQPRHRVEESRRECLGASRSTSTVMAPLTTRRSLMTNRTRSCSRRSRARSGRKGGGAVGRGDMLIAVNLARQSPPPARRFRVLGDLDRRGRMWRRRSPASLVAASTRTVLTRAAVSSSVDSKFERHHDRDGSEVATGAVVPPGTLDTPSRPTACRRAARMQRMVIAAAPSGAGAQSSGCELQTLVCIQRDERTAVMEFQAAPSKAQVAMSVARGILLVLLGLAALAAPGATRSRRHARPRMDPHAWRAHAPVDAVACIDAARRLPESLAIGLLYFAAGLVLDRDSRCGQSRA